jgi:hypothetical protein
MSIGTLMALIALVAAELALFHEVLVILVIPPVTMGVILLNLGLVFVLGRRSFLGARVIGMLMGGIVALFLMVAYYLVASPRTRFLGPLGFVVHGWLINLAGSQPDPAGPLATFFRRAAGSMAAVETVFIDLAGLLMIWAGGRLERWLRRDPRSAAVVQHAKGTGS